MKQSTFLSLVWIFLTISTSSFAQESTPSSVACINSLCGEANPFGHPFEGNKKLEDATKAKMDIELKKSVEKYMGRLINKALIQDNLFQQMIAQKDKLSITPKMAALLQSFRYANKLNEFWKAFDLSENSGGYVLNRDKLKGMMPNLNEDEINAIASFNQMIGFVLKNNSLFNMPLELVLKALNPELTLIEAQKAKAIQIIMVKGLIQDISPLTKYTNPVSVFSQRASSGATLSENEKVIFKKNLQNSYIVSYVLRAEVQEKFAKLPLDISQAVTEFQKTYSESKKYKAVHNPKSIRNLLQESVSTCSSRLAYAYMALPTDKQKNNFKADFEKIRLTAQQIIEAKTNSSLTDAFKIEVLLPGSRESFLSDIKSSFQDSTASYDEGIRELKKLDLKDAAVLGSVFATSMTFPDEDLLGEALEFCDQAKSPGLNDAALSQLKMINLSWLTVLHPKLGIGIVAHELGHIASANWKNYFKSEKNCLTQKQGSEKYLEEDFADLFATEVLRRMDYKSNGTVLGNFSCAFQNRTDVGWSLGELKNTNKTDDHAASFYRLMAVASSGTQLTNQCQAYLNSQSEIRFENYCKWGQ